MCLINTPPIFHTFWRIIKPFIPPRTLKRIHFLGDNYQETLLELFAAENLPAYLGGLCTCRCEDSCVPWPKSPGYRNPNTDEAGFTLVTLAPRAHLDIPIAIRQDELAHFQKSRAQRMSIKCSFSTDKAAVMFGIYFLEAFDTNFRVEEAAEIVPIRQLPSNSQLAEG